MRAQVKTTIQIHLGLGLDSGKTMEQPGYPVVDPQSSHLLPGYFISNWGMICLPSSKLTQTLANGGWKITFHYKLVIFRVKRLIYQRVLPTFEVECRDWVPAIRWHQTWLENHPCTIDFPLNLPLKKRLMTQILVQHSSAFKIHIELSSQPTPNPQCD